MMQTAWLPIPVTDLEIAFPVSVRHLIPPYEEIPSEFKKVNGTKWNQLFNEWFFDGVSSLRLKPKDGINKSDAMRHIKCIMGSFQPKHEHKEAAVAYLMSLWFEDATWLQERKAGR